MDDDLPLHQPIGPELDLHTFRPSETDELLPEYFRECLHRGIGTVRVIHGKGSGALRERVHAILRSSPMVESFQHPLAANLGGWGATMVRLRTPPTPAPPPRQ